MSRTIRTQETGGKVQLDFLSSLLPFIHSTKGSELWKEKISSSLSGTRHPLYGKHRSEMTKLKISTANKGRKLSLDWRLKISKNHADISGSKNPNYGKHLSVSTRLKLSKANTGRHLSEDQRIKITKATTGRHHSESSKLKISKALKGRVFSYSWKLKLSQNHADMRGKNSGKWLGGKSFEPYGLDFNKELKKQIRLRDNNICQLCGKGGQTIHHIDYVKTHNNFDNLCVLCRSCNAKVNVNREYWTKYFGKIRSLSGNHEELAVERFQPNGSVTSN